MNKKIKNLVYIFTIFICLLLVSCEYRGSTTSSYIPESKIETTADGSDWIYLESPSGRCYEVVTRVTTNGLPGCPGFYGMWRIPCDEIPNLVKINIDKE